MAARSKWEFTGKARPSFANEPGPTQRSVWDFPRPPAIRPSALTLTVKHRGIVVAQTNSACEVLETAGAPTYYFPPDDVDQTLIKVSNRRFHCEWKGISSALDLDDVRDIGWRLDAVYEEFGPLLGWIAFYPQHMDCFVGDERARPQPGGYYGGWVTKDIAGPVKGGPGSRSW